MGGQAVTQLDEAKLVAYLFDSHLGFGKMVDKLARKARTRIAALRRLKPMLDSDNLKTMYTMFIRSILEYGSLVYMGAAQSHLDKLDRVQQSAEKIGGFKVESLQSRREAATISLAFDLLNGSSHPTLLKYKHELIEPLKLTKKRTRYSVAAGTQLKSKSKTNSLDSFKRSYLGSMHKIWAKLPHSLISEGQSSSWKKVKKRAKGFLTGNWSPQDEPNTRLKKKANTKNDTHSTKLNNELNTQTDWNLIRMDMRNSGISPNANTRSINSINVTCK